MKKGKKSRWQLAVVGSLVFLILILAGRWFFSRSDHSGRSTSDTVQVSGSPDASGAPGSQSDSGLFSLLQPAKSDSDSSRIPTTQIHEGVECLKSFGLTQTTYTPDELLKALSPTQPPRTVRHTRQYSDGRQTVALQITPAVGERISAQSTETAHSDSPSDSPARAFRVRLFEIEKDGFPVLKSDQEVDDVAPLEAPYSSHETVLDERSLQVLIPQGLVTLSLRNGQIEWFDLPSSAGSGPVRCETDRDEGTRDQRLPLRCICASQD